MNAIEELDRLIGALDDVVAHRVGENVENAESDAIAKALQSPGRKTAVRSLRDSESLNRLRAELASDQVRSDTVAQSLRLVRQLVGALVATGA